MRQFATALFIAALGLLPVTVYATFRSEPVVTVPACVLPQPPAVVHSI